MDSKSYLGDFIACVLPLIFTSIPHARGEVGECVVRKLVLRDGRQHIFKTRVREVKAIKSEGKGGVDMNSKVK